MSREIRIDRLSGRSVYDSAGRKVGRIRELLGEIERPGSGEYVVREFHISTGGLLESLTGAQFARVFAERSGRRANRVVIDWRDLDLSNPERPLLRRPLAEIARPIPDR